MHPPGSGMLATLVLAAVLPWQLLPGVKGLRQPATHRTIMTATRSPDFHASSVSRRRVFYHGCAAALVGGALGPGVALAGDSPSTEQDQPSLRDRVEGGALRLPNYRVETPDVAYPAEYAGLWKSESSTVSVEAPSGVAMFGGNQTFAAAQAEVNTPPLVYSTRFRVVENGVVIADRAYNIESICKATMGETAIVDVPRGDDPNQVHVLIRGGTLIRVYANPGSGVMKRRHGIGFTDSTETETIVHAYTPKHTRAHTHRSSLCLRPLEREACSSGRVCWWSAGIPRLNPRQSASPLHSTCAKWCGRRCRLRIPPRAVKPLGHR